MTRMSTDTNDMIVDACCLLQRRVVYRIIDRNSGTVFLSPKNFVGRQQQQKLFDDESRHSSFIATHKVRMNQ
jgi:hypothetical protein